MKRSVFRRAQALALGLVCAASAAAAPSAVLPAVAATPISEVVNASGVEYDYARALQYSIYFYDANMCGTEVSENTRLFWRGDCHTYDAAVPLQPMNEDRVGTNLSQEFIDKYRDILDPDGDGGVDVAGGMHDAGDHVEFGMPENYAAATLGWGFYEFRDSYEKLGQDDHIKTVLRYFNDYLMKCTFRDADGTVIAHCYQVGDGDIDHKYWESPEVDTMERPAFFLTAEKPQTDYVVSACASLAINYLNFKDEDPEYAAKSLDYAKALWKFANDNPKELSDNGDGPGQYYASSKWEDDYCWAAAWMYDATGDESVFETAYELFDYYAPSGWCYCWNDMWSGAALRWAVINQEHPELDMVNKIRKAQGKNEYVFDDFWDNDCLGKCLKTWQDTETPEGYAYLNEWGSARYNTAMQLICLLYDKYHNDGKPSEWSTWARKQMDIVLGDNDVDFLERVHANAAAANAGEELPWSEDELHGSRSLVVGYNDDSVQYPHHRAASGLLSAEDTREQRHILWGALAGGFDAKDAHDDYTNNYILNEVTIDYNAAFVGACAGMYAMYGTDEMAVTPDFPPTDEGERGPAGGEGGGSGYWVEACAVNDANPDGSGVTKISLKVMTGENTPSDKISIRYYIDASEFNNNVSLLTDTGCRELYDQANTEDGPKNPKADGVLTGPFKYDKMDGVYYFEVTWDGYYIANSGKKYQFGMGMYYGGTWDPANDWSYQDLAVYEENDAFFADGSEQLAPNICVYDDGVLVGGTEPDGTKPEEETAPDQEATTSVTDPADVTYGDADCDGDVDIIDVIAVNKDQLGSFKLSADGIINADVDRNGVLNFTDAVNIMKFLVDLVELPV
ncbi:MAG: glycoside hydrolase family 9 protein [Oscillospiraceae bacterium]|nr:glycoside hydrolase family 9 protein [Oscillospiraceae bacterium]